MTETKTKTRAKKKVAERKAKKEQKPISKSEQARQDYARGRQAHQQTLQRLKDIEADLLRLEGMIKAYEIIEEETKGIK